MQKRSSATVIGKAILAILLMLSTGTLLRGQDVPSIIKAGDAYFDNEDYFRASNFFLMALEKEPNNITAKYRLAESYRLITNYETAEIFYGEVLRRSESRFPLARYYYALTQKFNGKYQEALNNFELFLQNVESREYTRLRGPAAITFSEQARIELEGCLMAVEELKETPFSHNFHLLGEPVNSTYNDYAAFTYHHDSTIVMTSARLETKGSHFDNRFGESLTDLFRFQFEEGTWIPVTTEDRFDKEINTKFHDGSGVFNRDFSQFYFTHCAPNEGCQIYHSTLKDDEWTTPVPLNTNVNKEGSDSMHPSLTASGDTLFFASDRPGGLGDFDIWMSVFGRGQWQTAQNLGDYVNTAFKEISPFYDYKGNTLFFASDGHIGHGGLDIIMGENIFDDEAVVFNMGLPFNSSRDDAFFTLGEHGGYLASNRSGGLGNFDIYSFQIDSDSQIISEVITSKHEASRNSIFVTDYAFDTPDIKMVEGIVSNLLASRLHSSKLPFSPSEQIFYDQLSHADVIRIERIVRSRMMSTQLANLQIVRHEDEFFYQQVAGDFRYYIDRMVTYYLEDYDMSPVVQIPDEDKAFYEELNSNSKGSIDRFIALKLNEYENLDLSDEYYTTLPLNDQKSIDNISENYLKNKANLSSLALTDVDAGFLAGLDESDRSRTELAIANQVGTISNQSDYSLSDVDKNFYEKLDGNGKNSLDNMAQSYIEASVNNLEDYLDPEDLAFYNDLKPKEQDAFNKLLAKRIQNFVKADKYTLDALRPNELQQIVSLQVDSTRNIDQVLADSTIQENSILKLMAKEDQKKFSRLLASAANLVMAKSSSQIKSTALAVERKSKLQKLITDYSSNQLQPTDQMAYYSQLDDGKKAIYEQLMIDNIESLYSDNDSISIDIQTEDGRQKFADNLSAQLDPKNPNSQVRLNPATAALSPEERQQLSVQIAAMAQELDRTNGDQLASVPKIQSMELETLQLLKSQSKAPTAYLTPDIATTPTPTQAIEPTTVSPASASGGIALSTAALAQISVLVSDNKRGYSENLSPETYDAYTASNPAEKRFMDQALNLMVQQMVTGNDPALSTAMTDDELINHLNQRFSVEKLSAEPQLRRYYAPIQQKSSEEKKVINDVLMGSALSLITAKRDELAGLMTNNPSAGQPTPMAKQSATPVVVVPAIQASEELKTVVIDTKPELLNDLSTVELQSYMDLNDVDKKLIDNVVIEQLQSYVNSNDPVLNYDKGSNTSATSRYYQLISMDFDLGDTAGMMSPSRELLINSEQYREGLTELLVNVAGIMITRNGDQLRQMAATAGGLVSEPRTTNWMDQLNANQQEIYNNMSDDEKQWVEAVFGKQLNSSDFELKSGTQTGQVVTIKIMDNAETLDVDNIEGQLKLVGPNKFKPGETLKLVWSDAQQTWYEIARTQE